MDLDDGYFRREMKIRRRILGEFNKTVEDFEDETGYNDYLEQVEDLIMALTSNPDDAATQERIRSNLADNAELIRNNRARKMESERKDGERIAREERQYRERLMELRRIDELERLEKRRRAEEEAREALEALSRKDKGKGARKKAADKERRKENVQIPPSARSAIGSNAVFPAFRPPLPPPPPVKLTIVPVEERQIDPALAAIAGGHSPSFPRERALQELRASLLLSN
mmetsp:Transcript_1729/g.3193  ORF Transcript_1729/g.3193 Transcript_1729/m.3193 type:complete len:228 (-) Transcript_1729:2426-3109(-)